MRVLMRCGCEVSYDERDANASAPKCLEHGEIGIARTVGAPAPRIRGVATGPHVRTEDLAPHTGVLPGVTPLAQPKESRS